MDLSDVGAGIGVQVRWWIIPGEHPQGINPGWASSATITSEAMLGGVGLLRHRDVIFGIVFQDQPRPLKLYENHLLNL